MAVKEEMMPKYPEELGISQVGFASCSWPRLF